LQLFKKVFEVQKVEMAQGLPAENPVTGAHLVETLLGQAEAYSSLAHLAEKPEEYELLFEDGIQQIKEAIEIDPDQKSNLLQEWASLLEARLDKRIEDDEEGKDVDLTEVIEKLKEAIEADPKNPGPYVDLAELYLNEGQSTMLKAAISQHDEESQEPPSGRPTFSPEVESSVWASFMKAVDSIKKAYEAEPTSTGIMQKAGDVYYQCARVHLDIAKASSNEYLTKAEDMYRKGIKEDEDDEELVIRLAQVKFVLGGRDIEVDELLTKFRELGGSLDDIIDEPEIFEEEFLSKVSEFMPEHDWEDVDDDDDEEEDD